MNILYERLPDYVIVQDHKYRIVTDFREWIKFLDLSLDEKIPVIQKVKLMIRWYIDPPININEEALEALFSFAEAKELYSEMGRHLPGNQEESGKTQEPAFSFEVDACCIYCAFMEYYNIDLQVVQMHWWKFKVLFDGLPEESEIKQRIHYRAVDLSKIKDKEERKRIKEIQRRIALPVSRRDLPDDFEIGDMF